MGEGQQEATACSQEPLLPHDAHALDWLGRPRPPAARLGGWKCASLLLGSLLLCFLAFYGILLNLVVFLTEQLGESNAAAASTVTTLSGTQMLCSFLGAVFSDAFLGRLWTLLLFQTLAALCYIVLVVVVVATGSARSLLLVSLYVMAVASGLATPNLLGLGVDQLKSIKDKEKYFQLVTIAILIGQLLATTLVSYIDDGGMWGWGFGLSAIASLACLSLIAVGLRWFCQHRASGNPFVRNCQVLVAALKKHRLPLPEDSALLHECKGDASTILGGRKLPHTRILRCLDKAAVIVEAAAADAAVGSWHLCTVTQVEEFKSLLRVIPAGVSVVFTFAAVTQVSTLFEEQALTMNRHLGAWFVAPAASVNVLSNVSGILAGLVVASGSVMKVSRWCLGCKTQRRATSLQVLGVSLLCSIISMVVAALVESYRLHVARKGGITSIMWLAPQTILVGAAISLSSSSSLDFFYSEISDSMRSMAGSLTIVMYGAGSYLNSIFVALITAITTRGGRAGWIAGDLDQGHADYFYWFLASLMAFGLAFHIAYACAYKYSGNDRVYDTHQQSSEKTDL